MEPIPNYTFDFTKYPPLKCINKKYFIEWITIDENNEKYLVDFQEFDSFEEACKQKTGPQEKGIGYLFRNRRFKCQIK